MISESLLSQSLRGNSVTPLFLGPEDIPWLDRLIEEFARFKGRRFGDLKARLKEPMPFSALPFKKDLATLTLLRTLQPARTGDSKSAIKARLLRAALFRTQCKLQDKEKAIIEVANCFQILPEILMNLLFSDLWAERLIEHNSISNLTALQLALQTNLFLVKSLLARSRNVKIEIYGQCRPVIRQAKLKGLICVIETNESKQKTYGEMKLNSNTEMYNGFRLIVSGPYSIFRHTLIYGRHLGELLPFLQNCDRFELEATCLVKQKERVLKLTSGAPLPPKKESKRFDSQLERSFFREFSKLAIDWNLIREPEPIISGRGWIFPDFEIRNRRFPERRYFLEIVGFWHPDYLRDKLKKLAAAKLTNFIICIDRKFACGNSHEWQATGGHIFEFSKRINPASILELISSPHFDLINK